MPAMPIADNSAPMVVGISVTTVPYTHLTLPTTHSV